MNALPILASTCNTQADYAQVAASPALPFLFVLDEVNSLLYPVEGEQQKFCYNIIGTGTDTSDYADLSHFVLVVCDTMTLDDIVSAQVTIDGQVQEVTLGGNVTIMTVAKPDPTTSCPGLKFDFGLAKDGGEMSVCFTLARAFPIGAVTVCVKGGQTSLHSLAICGPVCSSTPSCSATVAQRATLCVPVTVSPYATTGVITTACCGAPRIEAGVAECAGNPNTSCTFTISQDICLAIPVSFGANATPGACHTTCLGPEVGGTCTGCTQG